MKTMSSCITNNIDIVTKNGFVFIFLLNLIYVIIIGLRYMNSKLFLIIFVFTVVEADKNIFVAHFDKTY